MKRSEKHTSELQSQSNLVCRLLLEKKKDINVDVDLAADGNVTLEFRMRGVPPATSPLEDAVWNSFNDRADFPSWIAQSRCYARWMFNVTAWDARSASIDANGTIWSGAATVGQPRVVRMSGSSPAGEPIRTP